jgi:uroporphyrinogen-III synthase
MWEKRDKLLVVGSRDPHPFGKGDHDDHEPSWIVFFAPSAASHVMPALRRHLSLPAREPASLPQGEGKLCRARLAAIGLMTMVYLREELGLVVEAVAEMPNAESLVVALLSSAC